MSENSTPVLDDDDRLWLRSRTDPSVQVEVATSDVRYEELRSEARANRRKIIGDLLAQVV